MWPFTRQPDICDEVIAALREAIAEQAKALAAHAHAHRAYMESFQITTPPESRILRDEDEYRLEQERLEQAGQQPMASPYFLTAMD